MENTMHPFPRAAVERTLEILRAIDNRAASPAILCSWSKDSMVLRDIIRQAGYDWPVITFMTEWHPRKWAFARDMSQMDDDPIITYHPQGTWIYEQDGAVVFGSTYQLGVNPEYPGLEIHVDVIEPHESATELPPGYECGLKYIARLTGTIEWRWDAVAIGHRDVDRDRFLGAIPLTAEIIPNADGHPDLCFPLKHWTDREIWDYTMHEALDVDWRRYSAEDRWGDPEFVPTSLLNEHNNDCIHACARCLKCGPPPVPDRPGPYDPAPPAPPVHCPALNETIASHAHIVERKETLAKLYFTPTK